MNKSFYRKVIKSSEVDLSFLRFQAEDMFKDKSLFEKFKAYLILHAIAAPNEDFPPVGKQELRGMFNWMGEDLKDEILPTFEKWYDRHTSPEKLLGLDEWQDDREATLAWPFVDEGSYWWNDVNQQRHDVNIINLAMKYWKQEMLPQAYDKEDRDSIRGVYDEIVNGGANWSDYLDEATRIHLVQKCAPYIFREWKKIFGKDLKVPQQQVGLAIQRIRNADENSLPGALSLALNVAHVFGKMFQHLDLSQDEMDQLHVIQQPEIESVKKKLLDLS